MHPFEGEREKAEKNGTKSEWRKNIENHKRFEFSVGFLFWSFSILVWHQTNRFNDDDVVAFCVLFFVCSYDENRIQSVFGSVTCAI